MVHCKKFLYVNTSDGFKKLNDFLKKLKPEEIIDIEVIIGNDTHCYLFYDQRRFMNESSS